MKRTVSHTHPCAWKLAGCSNLVDCDAPYERNWDGFPEVICAREARDERMECDECAEAHSRQCPDCGVWAFHLGETHDIECSLAPTGVQASSTAKLG